MSMEQVREYLVYLLYAALLVSFAMLLWHFLMHKQWQTVLLSVFFSVACGGGFLIALIVGWQEAGKWGIKKLMRVYTVLCVVSFFVAMNGIYKAATAPPELDAKQKAKLKAQQQVQKAMPGR